MSTFLNFKESCRYLGVSEPTLRRYLRVNLINAIKSPSGRVMIAEEELERFENTEYPEGMTHTDIAERYGIGRTSVIYHFQRLKVKRAGKHLAKGHAAVYAVSTVEKFARLLGWSPISLENQTDGS